MESSRCHGWVTIPNALSFFRLLLIPIYVNIYCNANVAYDYFLAATILALSCLTDYIDGKIARRFNMISTIGKILDPLADKATQLTLIICLAFKYYVFRYLIVLYVTKELFQIVAGIINWKNGKMLKGALITGKVCTAVLFVSLILLVLLPNLPADYVTGIVVVDMMFISASFLDYIFAYLFRPHLFSPIPK